MYAAETTANWATINVADIWVMMQMRDLPVHSCMLYNTLCYVILEISSLVCGIIFIAGADLDTFFFFFLLTASCQLRYSSYTCEVIKTPTHRTDPVKTDCAVPRPCG